MPLMMLLSALICSLPFVLTKWQLAVIGWIPYMLAVFLGNDEIEYV